MKMKNIQSLLVVAILMSAQEAHAMARLAKEVLVSKSGLFAATTAGGLWVIQGRNETEALEEMEEYSNILNYSDVADFKTLYGSGKMWVRRCDNGLVSFIKDHYQESVYVGLDPLARYGLYGSSGVSFLECELLKKYYNLNAYPVEIEENEHRSINPAHIVAFAKRQELFYKRCYKGQRDVQDMAVAAGTILSAKASAVTAKNRGYGKAGRVGAALATFAAVGQGLRFCANAWKRNQEEAVDRGLQTIEDLEHLADFYKNVTPNKLTIAAGLAQAKKLGEKIAEDPLNRPRINELARQLTQFPIKVNCLFFEHNAPLAQRVRYLEEEIAQRKAAQK